MKLLDIDDFSQYIMPNKKIMADLMFDYKVFKNAVTGDDIEEKCNNEQIQKIIDTHYDKIFTCAALYRDLKVLYYLEAKAPDRLQELIAAYHSVYFSYASHHGYLDLLMYLEEKAPDKLITMLSQDSYCAFNNIYHTIYSQDYLYHILDLSEIFDYAEKHYVEYRIRVKPYVDSKVNLMLDENWDIADSQVWHYFILLRNLIKRNEPNLLVSIKKLINHPKLAPFLMQNNNELLIIAQAFKNHALCFELMRNQHVRNLARQNNFYGKQNLANFAEDAESSMRSFSLEEKNMIEDIMKLYLKQFEKLGGSEAVLDDLKFDLLKQANFSASLEERYQNPFDTAWRYLTTPNPLLHVNASFTINGGANIADSDKELIALLYLAAIDTNQPPTIGTIEDRFKLFAQGLADLGRAHNQDEGQDTFLEGDKPSCLSGVRKRIFLLLQNHPMFKMVNTEIVKQALAQIAHQHFKAILDKIDDDSLCRLNEFYLNYLDANEEINTIRHSFNLDNNYVHHALEIELGSKYQEYKTKVDSILLKTPHIEGFLGNQTCFFIELQDKVETSNRQKTGVRP